MRKRRTIKRFQRTFAVLGLLVVLSSFISVPVYAAEYSGGGKLRNYAYPYSGGVVADVNSCNIDIPLVNQAGFSSIAFDANGWKVAPQVSTDADVFFDSVTDIYFSFYPYTTSSNTLYYYGDPYNASNWHGNYINSQGQWGSLSSVELDTFAPVTSNKYHRGVSLVARYVGSEGLPISQLTLGTAVLDGTTFVPSLNAWGFRDTDPVAHVLYYITSLRVITSDSTADSEAIADVANQIGAMSDVLQAKLGDIAYIVQLIYEETQDINATLEICKGYFQSMLDAIENIDGTVTDIYSLLDTQLQMLIAAINTASSDIQSSITSAKNAITYEIYKQTRDMEEFFNNVFGGAVNDQLTGETDGIQSGMDNVDNAEQGYISTATDRFDGIVGSFTGFNGSVASGVSLVSTLFERVWNSFGEYIVVYSFPLSLGLVLLLIGRISRASARSSRGSSKDKGGGNE